MRGYSRPILPSQYGVSLGLTSSQLNNSVGWSPAPDRRHIECLLGGQHPSRNPPTNLQPSSYISPPGGLWKEILMPTDFPGLISSTDESKLLSMAPPTYARSGIDAPAFSLKTPSASITRESSIVILVLMLLVSADYGAHKISFSTIASSHYSPIHLMSSPLPGESGIEPWYQR